MEQGAKAMDGLLEKYSDTDAVMCVSDLSAFGAMMACARRGLKVPDDIAIAGSGAYDISANAYPSMTTLDVGDYTIGIKTAEVIVNALFDEVTDKSKAQRVEIDITLIERDSAKKLS